VTLYLVRLLQGFRFPEVMFDWRRSTHPPIVRAFQTRADAERFVAEDVPIWQNPFDSRAINVWPEQIETWHWDEDLYDRASPDAGKHIASWVVFHQTLDALGLPHPKLPKTKDEDILQQALISWWNETPITDAQKTALWQLIDPHPYRIDEVEIL
jgi:hypothetical protein